MEKYECPKCWNNMFEDTSIYPEWHYKCMACWYEYDLANLIFNKNKND